MRSRIAMALIIILAIFLGGCAGPQKKVVPPKPVSKAPARIGDLDSKLTDLTNQIINSLTETRRSRIAIIEFSDLEGNITEFGKYLSEELITRLFMTRRFEVVERQFLNKVIQEHKLSYTQFFDEESIKDIGKLLGVDAIGSGSVTDLGRSVKVNARLIATETGSIFAVAAVEILKDDKVAMLLAKKAKSPYLETKIAAKTPEIPPLTLEKPAPEEPKEKPRAALQKVEANDLTFELKEAKMSGTNITCKLLITNNDQDRELRLLSSKHGYIYNEKSRLFDNIGNEYGSILAQIGNKKGRHPIILLVSGIPTQAILYFEKISSQARRIALLELCYWDSLTKKPTQVQFRNIPLSR